MEIGMQIATSHVLPLKLTVAALLHEVRRLGVAVPTAAIIPDEDDHLGLPSSSGSSLPPLVVMVGDPSSKRCCSMLLESLCGVRLGDVLLQQGTSVDLGATPLIVRVVNSKKGGGFESEESKTTTISMSHAMMEAGEEIRAEEKELMDIASALRQLHLEAASAAEPKMMSINVGDPTAITLTIHHHHRSCDWRGDEAHVDFTFVILPAAGAAAAGRVQEEEVVPHILVPNPPLDEYSNIQHDLHHLILPFLRPSSILILDMHMLSVPPGNELSPHFSNWPPLGLDVRGSTSTFTLTLVTQVFIRPRCNKENGDLHHPHPHAHNHHLRIRMGVHSKCTMCLFDQLSLPETSLHRLYHPTSRRRPSRPTHLPTTKSPAAALKTSLLIETASRLSTLQKRMRRELRSVFIPFETQTAFRCIAESVQRDLGAALQAQHPHTEEGLHADLRRSFTSSEIVSLPLRVSCLKRMRRLLGRPRPGRSDGRRMPIREAAAKIVTDLAKRRLLDAWWRDIGVRAMSWLQDTALETVRAVVGKHAHAEERGALQKMYDASFQRELAKCKVECERMIRRLLKKEIKGAVLGIVMQKNAGIGTTTTTGTRSTSSNTLSVMMKLRGSGPFVVSDDATEVNVVVAQVEDGAVLAAAAERVREVAAEALINWASLLRHLAEDVPRELIFFFQKAILNVSTHVATALQQQDMKAGSHKRGDIDIIAEALVEEVGSGSMVEDYRHVRLCKSLLFLLISKQLPKHVQSLSLPK